jgi:endonuclease YncB( thermonuclease family)
MRRLTSFAAILFVLLSLAAPVEGFAFSLPADSRARVIAVIDGDTVKLDNGREVRLVGIQAPKLPLGRRGFAAWPLADEAKAKLETLTARKLVTLHYGGAREDRHGRLLAHLTTQDEAAADRAVWVQGDMLKAGLARVYSFPDNRALVAEMLAFEREARAARRGIWRNPYYRIRKPEETRRDIETFQLVEGRVLQAASVKDRVYLNFGPDYRTDFTIAIARRNLRLFGRGFDAQALEGRSVRVRGWLKSINGPMIEATHPEQLEVLTP